MGDLTRIDQAMCVEITDGSSQSVIVATAAPGASDAGLVVRNVPTGTQTIAGTITSVPSGTQTVVGTVTNVPSGTQTVAGSVTAVGAKAEDAVFNSGDAGHFVLAVRNDSATATTNTDGDYSQISTDSAGRVGISDLGGSITVDGTVTAVPTGTQAVSGTITNVPSGTQTVAGTVTTVPSGTQTVAGTITAVASGSHIVVGNTAHDAVDADNPIKVGGQARQTNPTAVADSDRTNAIFDDVGRQVCVLNHVRDLVTQATATFTNTTEGTVLSAGAAGVFHDLTQLILTNTSATMVRVDIRDDTAGTVIFSVNLAASGGGAVIPFNVPLKQGTAAKNWTAQLSASVTDVRVFMQAVKNV